jgi:hypothetical protein
MFLQNISSFSPNYTALYPRKTEHFIVTAVRTWNLVFGAELHWNSFSSSGDDKYDLIITPWSWALLEKPPIAQLLKNFPTFYGTRKFITVFTRVLYWYLSWARWIQSTPPHPISLRSIFILSSYLRLGLPSGFFPSGLSTKILYAFHFSICATCPVHLNLLDFISLIILGEEYKLQSSSLCSFPTAP